MALTDSTGTLQTSYRFDPFGGTSAVGAVSTNTFAYTGRELDAGNLNLYFYRARYYNPMFQRFISEDPISFRGGSPDLYTYAFNSPLSLRDPIGLWGAGVTMGYSFSGGLGGSSGAGGTASVGGIYFGDPSNPVGFTSAGFASQGGFGGPAVGEWGNPATGNMVGGIGSGFGIGPIITNAKSKDDLAGPFVTDTLSIPGVTFELSRGSGASGLFHPSGTWVGPSFMHYCTNIWTNPVSDESFSHPGSPGGRCGCNTGPMF